MVNGTISAEQLRLFIERVERLKEEKQGILDDAKDVLAEAKGKGFDPSLIRWIEKQKRIDPEARKERRALEETYAAALGIDL